MLPLKLTSKPKRTEVLVAETLEVEVTLHNTGAEPIEVPSPDEPTTFRFILRATEEGRPSYALSLEDALAARYDDERPELVVEKVVLNPGASVSYTPDIAAYAVEPLLPGQYTLSAAYSADDQRIVSPAVPVRILAPRVLRMATAPGPTERRLGHVIAHADASGKTVVLQRESRPAAPDDGVWYRRADVAPPVQVEGVACAVELERSYGARWFAWLHGDALSAAVAELRSLAVRVDRMALGLSRPALHGVGWQPSVESATFALVGRDAGERVAFAAATFKAAQGGSGSVKSIPLAAAAAPAQWAAQYSPRDKPPRFAVVWVEGAGKTIRVQRQAVSPEAGKAEAPALLLERHEPLAALALNPLAGSEQGVVDVLFGPVGDGGKLTLLRLPLDGKPPVAEWSFPAPDDPGKKRPTAWALASTPLPEPFVVAKLGDKLLVRRAAEDSGWVTLAENAAKAEQLRLEVIGDVAWAIWADPALGLQYRPVR